MKALVIVSAHAGKGDHDNARETITREFTAAGIEFAMQEIHRDDKPEEVVRTRLREGFDFVVAAGGDGTVSRAFDGLYGSSVPLGIIPTGTGNLIAREFDIPTALDDAVALLARGARAKKIDAMRVGKRVCVLNAGVGINAEIIAGTTRKSKQRLGRFAYYLTALKMTRLRPRHLQVTVDGVNHQYRAVEVSISNCGVIAKTLYPNGPDIRTDDGRLDICILSMATFFDYVKYLTGVVFGRRARAQFLVAEKSVSIRSGSSLIAQADGDIIGRTPLEVEVLKGALTVLVPAAPPDS